MSYPVVSSPRSGHDSQHVPYPSSPTIQQTLPQDEHLELFFDEHSNVDRYCNTACLCFGVVCISQAGAKRSCWLCLMQYKDIV